MIQIKKTILTLVALLAVTTGAWAQTETLLTTITATSKDTYSETTPGVVTVTHDNNDFDGDFGWLWHKEGAITVKANEGYTITKCVFSQPFDKTVTVSTAPFKVNIIYNEEYLNYICEGSNPDEGTMDGVLSIEVYGGVASAASAFDVDWNKAEKTGTFKMPGGNVTLEPEYFPQAALTAVPTAINDVPATTDGAIVEAGTVANIGETTTAQGTVMYYAVQSATAPTAPDYDATGWTDKVPTATDFAEGNVYVWYYIKGAEPASGTDRTDANTCSDSEITALGTTGYVTLAAPPTYAITLKEGTEDVGEWTISPAEATKGTTITATYSGTKRVKSVKAVKKGAAAKPLANATTEDLGKVVGADGNIYANKDAAEAANTTAVAMICYVNEGHGLALALTDEVDKMNWSTAQTTCDAHTPAITGGKWMLASKGEWDNMISAAGSYSALRDGFSSVGGTNMQSEGYWSSTEDDSSDAWNYYFSNGLWSDVSKDWNRSVRACLAF